MSTAGIIILPRPDGVDEEESIEDGVDEEDFIEDSVDEEESIEDVDMLEPEQAPSKWPRKPESQYDLFNPEDSWFDAPPEGFNLTVRVFLYSSSSGSTGEVKFDIIIIIIIKFDMQPFMYSSYLLLQQCGMHSLHG